MIKKYNVFVENKYYLLENNSIKSAFIINNTVISFSKAYLCKINLCCLIEMFPLIIRGGDFVTA